MVMGTFKNVTSYRKKSLVVMLLNDKKIILELSTQTSEAESSTSFHFQKIFSIRQNFILFCENVDSINENGYVKNLIYHIITATTFSFFFP